MNNLYYEIKMSSTEIEHNNIREILGSPPPLSRAHTDIREICAKRMFEKWRDEKVPIHAKIYKLFAVKPGDRRALLKRLVNYKQDEIASKALYILMDCEFVN
jgi:hypothetical protein